jgi:2'-5' RNA ligase
MTEVPPDERQTALIVAVPAESLVDDFRRRHAAHAFERGLPPHVTVLYPFAPASSIDNLVHGELEAHFSAFASFAAELTEVGQFETTIWLAPSPRSRFVDLLTATHARFPDFPPYGGEVTEPEPHLTVAELGHGSDGGVEQVAELARLTLEPQLPFRFFVGAVTLIEEQGDGNWRESRRYELGSATKRAGQ